MTETSASTTDALALGTGFDPVALAAGTQITGTVSGTCKSLSANTVTITFGNGNNLTGSNRAMKCAACAGPSPFDLLQYQIYETNGTTVFPSGGVSVTCTGNCKSAGAGSTYTYNFVGQIITPSAATSLNDSQIGSYTDSLVATATGSGVAAVTTTISVTATVTQFCTVSTTTNVGFGSYDPVTVTTATDSTGVITITCTRGNSGVTLTLSGGDNAAHATAPSTRAMVGASHGNYISYDIFETNAYATRYPTTALSETGITGGITTPTALSLFGQIPATAQDVSVDSYSDSVTATINF